MPGNCGIEALESRRMLSMLVVSSTAVDYTSPAAPRDGLVAWDGVTTIADFALLASRFGQRGDAIASIDRNADGVIDGADVRQLQTQFNLRPVGITGSSSAIRYFSDGTPVEIRYPLAGGDFTYDGQSDINDYALLAANFNQSSPVILDGDLNGDGAVTLADFDHFLANPGAIFNADLIIRSAGPGDADCNGRINKFDIRSLGAKFNSSGAWTDGDFTMNGRVDIRDFALAAANVAVKRA